MNAIARRIIVTAALVGAALAAVPAVGNAAGSNERRFIATVEGSQTSTHFNPRANGTATCFGTSWVEGEGTQEFKFKSKPAKLLVYGSGKSTYFSFNSFKRDNYDDEVMVPFTMTRDGEIRHGEDPGPCGGGEPTTNTGPYDCGTKRGVFDADLSTSGGKLELSVGPTIGYPWKHFQDCPVYFGDGVSDTFTTIGQSFSRKKLFSGKPLTIRASKTFSQPGEIGRRTTYTTGVTWTLKLKPVAKKK